ncbi:hypothetical protein AWV80_02740 [Cupriavidus sp. UYMU48A]|nr:hypothetical protein AWV80_02740 [Cupriavidus sp. UYMU48A]
MVDSVAALRALSKAAYARAFVTGYRAAGDGGGGSYWYDPSDTTSVDNGGTIIVATDGGRWKLLSLHYVTLKTFGAYGDADTGSPHDDTAACQAALTWAAASGVTLRATAGSYAISSAITVNTTTGGNISQGGRRLSIVGDGKSNTSFVFTGNTNISLITVNGNYNDYFHAEGFRIQRKDAASEFGIGLTINNMVNFTLRAIECFRLDTGIVINDCNAVLLDDVTLRYNRLGLSAFYTSVSVPNAMTFSNCSINSNIQGGVSIVGGVTNVFLNCRLEGNGITDAGTTTAGAKALYIRTHNPVNTDFMSALTMVSCYFEGNAGDADFYGDFRGATTVNISGTLFNRTNVSNYVVNDIVFDGSAMTGSSQPVALEMSGNSFTSQGSYVPDVSRKAINYLHGASYTGFQINDCNIYQNAVDTPLVDGSKDRLRGDQVKVLAMGNITGATGVLNSNYGVTSVTKNATGNFTINLKNSAATAMGSFEHVSGGANAGLIHQITNRTASSITVQWMNPALAAQDPVSFDFVLFPGF